MLPEEVQGGVAEKGDLRTLASRVDAAVPVPECGVNDQLRKGIRARVGARASGADDDVHGLLAAGEALGLLGDEPRDARAHRGAAAADVGRDEDTVE